MKLFSHLGMVLVALPIAAWAVVPGSSDRARQEVSVTPDSRSADTLPDMTPAGPDMAWVDPVITGPVSPRYKRIREAAHCDTARWPDIPAVCFPD